MTKQQLKHRLYTMQRNQHLYSNQQKKVFKRYAKLSLKYLFPMPPDRGISSLCRELDVYEERIIFWRLLGFKNNGLRCI